MSKETFQLMSWTMGRLGLYFTLMVLLLLAIIATSVYIQNGSLVNLWEMPLNYGSTCLGEVLGVYTPKHDLFLMPNQAAIRSDVLYVIVGFAFIAANALTIRDWHKRGHAASDK